MNRALHKMTDAERADEELFVANVMRAIREEEAMEIEQRSDKKRAPEGAVVAYIIIAAMAVCFLGLAFWFAGVVL